MSRRAGSWPAPAVNRHAWLREGKHPHDVPQQVLVVAWARQSYRWSALVVQVVDTGQGWALVQRWVPAEQLRPASKDPNRGWSSGISPL